MGQKVNPNGLRLGVNKDWQSKWFKTGKEYVTSLNNDLKIRKFLETELKDASVAEILIERTPKRNTITIFSAKPGVVIGKGAEGIEKLRKSIKKVSGEEFYVTISEVKSPDLNAKLVAESIAKQIENRGNYKTIQKKAIKNTLRAGAKGIKTMVSGRLNGAEMARSEFYVNGTVPLQTIRADVDYAIAEANTTYGKIGVKVWIYKGEILGNAPVSLEEKKEKRTPKKDVKKGGNNDVNA